MDQPIPLQQRFWNDWNASTREHEIGEASRDQRDSVLRWLSQTRRTDLDLLEVGCGAGWLCPSLKPFGRVTATDLSDEVLGRARERIPGVDFIAGDFMALDLPPASFDVVVTLEVLSHVADQPAFVRKLATLLRPGGVLMLATQNRPVLERHNRAPEAKPGQLRRWVDRRELTELLEPYFVVRELRALSPRANKGLMRIVAGRKAQRLMRVFLGRTLERALAACGFGWTLMVLAEKRGAAERVE